MHQRRVTATALTVAFVALTFAAGCNRTPEPHLVGQLATLTGPDVERGQQAVRGVQLAVEQANAEPSQWIGGRKVAVLHVDTLGDWSTTGHQAVRLAALNKVVALIGGTNRAQAEAVIPACREYALVYVNSAGFRGIPSAESAFALGLSTTERAKTIANYLISVRKAESATLVCDDRDTVMVAFAEAFRRAFGKPVTVATEVKGVSGPIIVAASASRTAALVRQMSVPRDVYAAADDTGMAELARQGHTIDGIIAASSFAVDESTPFATAFATKFGVPADAEALAAYESARVLFSAARDVKTFASAKLRPKLAELKDFAGVNGPISMGSEGVTAGPSFLMQLTAGRWKVIRSVPASLP